MILVIEDDLDSRTLLERALRLEDYEVTAVDNAKAALKLLHEGLRPALILVDLSMPEMEGGTFIELLKSNPTTAAFKIVVVSGWDDIAKRSEAVGANGYIRKPYDLKTLIREVKKHV